MAPSETRQALSPDNRSSREPVFPHLFRSARAGASTIARGIRAKARPERHTNLAMQSPQVDLTDKALSFLPPVKRAEVWARFDDLNEHDAKAVEPVGEVARNARVNGNWSSWFVETAVVNSRHGQRLPFSVSLGLRADGPERVQEYLATRGHTDGTSESTAAVFVDHAARVIREYDLPAGAAEDVEQKFRSSIGVPNVTNHLTVIAERMAKAAARNREHAQAPAETTEGTELVAGEEIEFGETKELVFSH